MTTGHAALFFRSLAIPCEAAKHRQRQLELTIGSQHGAEASHCGGNTEAPIFYLGQCLPVRQFGCVWMCFYACDIATERFGICVNVSVPIDACGGELVTPHNRQLLQGQF